MGVSQHGSPWDGSEACPPPSRRGPAPPAPSQRPRSVARAAQVRGLSVARVSVAELVMLLEWWSGTECVIYTDPRAYPTFGKENAIVVLNHKFEIDFLCGWSLAERFGVLGVSLPDTFLPRAPRLAFSSRSVAQNLQKRHGFGGARCFHPGLELGGAPSCTHVRP